MMNIQTNILSFIQVTETLKPNTINISCTLRNATNSSQGPIAGRREKPGRPEKLERPKRKIRN